MDQDLDATLMRYKEFFDHITNDSVEQLREFASPDVRYRDPFVDARGIDAVIAYMHRWFAGFEDLRFETKSYARNGLDGFSHWRMTFRIRRNPKKFWEIEGISKIVLDSDGRIKEQTDFWDPSPLYESFPVLGRAITIIRKLAAKKSAA